MSEPGKPAQQDGTGHYGPGYGDPVEHLGQTRRREGNPAPADADPAPAAGTDLPAQSVAAGEGVDAQNPGEPPSLRSEDVSVPPPDRVPEAPASENAGLIFERS